MADELELFSAPTPEPTKLAPIARIALDVPLRRVFDYTIPAALEGRIQVGARVVVNFHGRRATGFVTELPPTSDVELSRLKPLLELVDASEPPLTAEILSLGLWVSSYYACGPG